MKKTSLKYSGNKPRQVKKLIKEILDILEAVGIPTDMTDRRLEKMAMACLAVGNIKSSLQECETDHFLKTREIITYENQNFGENISYGSYDDIRRKDLLYLVEAGIVINSSNLEEQAVNNPTRGYAIAPHFAGLIKQYGTPSWEEALKSFEQKSTLLAEELKRKRELERIPVILPSGAKLMLSAGEHNVLQKKIIEEFLPRFGFKAELLYLGDTENKQLFKQEEKLGKIGFYILDHEELPDVVAYSYEKNILFLIEAVHSAGPMSEIRVRKLKRQLEQCKSDIVFVTAFLDKPTFRKWVVDIAWETEVWIADAPDHLIHFNGYKFLEIHK